MLTARQATAGRVLADIAGKKWCYPGLYPDVHLFSAWPRALRILWGALRRADVLPDVVRKRMPTPSMVAWRVAVTGERPGILHVFTDNPDMNRLELQALKAGLTAIADRIEAEPLPSADAAEQPKTQADMMRQQVQTAARELLRGGWPPCSRQEIADRFGITIAAVRQLRTTQRARPDLLPAVATGEMTINAAATLSAAVPSRDGKAVTAALIRSVREHSVPTHTGAAYHAMRLLRDHPDIAARAEAGAFPSIRAACIAAGILKEAAQ